VHFGLGETPGVDRLEVRWPGGLEEEFRDLAADRVIRIEEGQGTPKGQPAPGDRR
jgi:hypothetical protein